MLSALTAILAITIIGFIAQRLGLCLVRATQETWQGKPSLLLAILLSGLWVWLYSIVALNNNWELPFTRFSLHPVFALGGFIFGFGASINQGCSISTMNHLARGNISMLFTLFGWFFGWCIWNAFIINKVVDINFIELPNLGLQTLVAISLPIFLITCTTIIFIKGQRQRWLGITIIGALAGGLFYLEPAWVPSKLIQDSGSALIEGKTMPSGLRFLLISMLLFGMWLSVFFTHDVKLRWPTWHKIVRHGLAGIMMGIGGAMALGGNDTQLMTGLPAASFGGMLALIFMIIGISTEQLLYKRGLALYQKR